MLPNDIYRLIGDNCDITSKLILFKVLNIPYDDDHSTVISEVVKTGNMDMVMECYQIGFPITKSTIINASRYGYLNILSWLKSKYKEYPYITLENACAGGHLHILQSMNINPNYKREIIFSIRAAECGSVLVLQWLKDNNFLISGKVALIACRLGNFDVLRFYYPTLRITPHCVQLLVMNGHLNILKQLDFNDFMWYIVRNCMGAHLNIIMWYISNNGQPINYGLSTINAAESGAIDVLQFINLPLQYNLMNYAVIHNQLECAKWLYQFGLPINSTTLLDAVENNCLDIVKWLMELGITPNDKDVFLYTAFKSKNIELIRLFYYECPQLMNWAVVSNHTPSVELLFDYNIVIIKPLKHIKHALYLENVETVVSLIEYTKTPQSIIEPMCKPRLWRRISRMLACKQQK